MALSNYDRWLTTPYEDDAFDSDAFCDWAEEQGFDLDDPAQVSEAEDDYQDHLNDLREDAMISRYEDEMERRAEERAERHEREYEGWDE